MIALDLLLALLDLAGEKTDIANVILRAGIMAAVRCIFTGPSRSTRASHHCTISSAWRLVSEAEKRHPTLPVQADKAGTDRGSLMVRRATRWRFRQRHLAVGNSGDQQNLPHREANIAVAELMRDPRKAAHLFRREPRHRAGPRDPIRSLLLSVSAPMCALRQKARRGK